MSEKEKNVNSEDLENEIKNEAKQENSQEQEMQKLKQELLQIRSNGYAIENEENQLGVISISAPIFSLNGTVAAGISIGLIKAILTDELKQQIIADILDCSQKISKEMGYKL